MPDDRSGAPTLTDQLRTYADWVHETTFEAHGDGPTTGSDNDVRVLPLTFEPTDAAPPRRPATSRILGAAAAAAVLLGAGLTIATRGNPAPIGMSTESTEPVVPGSTEATPATTPATTSPSTTVAATGELLPWPISEDSLVSCSDVPGPAQFPRAALDNPTGAENDPDPAGDALRRMLLRFANHDAGPGIPPQTGWRRVVDWADRVVFTAMTAETMPGPAGPETEGPFHVVFFTEPTPGGWTDADPGSCLTLSAVVPGRTNLWVGFAPTRPAADAVQLPLQLFAMSSCVAPFTVADVVTNVVETDDAVIIHAVSSVPPMNVATPETTLGCGTTLVPPVELTVPLDRPLGQRQVLRGNLLDPMPVGEG